MRRTTKVGRHRVSQTSGVIKCRICEVSSLPRRIPPHYLVYITLVHPGYHRWVAASTNAQNSGRRATRAEIRLKRQTTAHTHQRFHTHVNAAASLPWRYAKAETCEGHRAQRGGPRASSDTHPCAPSPSSPRAGPSAGPRDRAARPPTAAGTPWWSRAATCPPPAPPACRSGSRPTRRTSAGPGGTRPRPGSRRYRASGLRGEGGRFVLIEGGPLESACENTSRAGRHRPLRRSLARTRQRHSLDRFSLPNAHLCKQSLWPEPDEQDVKFQLVPRRGLSNQTAGWFCRWKSHTASKINSITSVKGNGICHLLEGKEDLGFITLSQHEQTHHWQHMKMSHMGHT